MSKAKSRTSPNSVCSSACQAKSTGDVIVEADSAGPTLLRYKRNPHHAAQNGTHGQGKGRHGADGADLVVLCTNTMHEVAGAIERIHGLLQG